MSATAVSHNLEMVAEEYMYMRFVSGWKVNMISGHLIGSDVLSQGAHRALGGSDALGMVVKLNIFWEYMKSS